MSWLDRFFQSITRVAAGGSIQPYEPTINFVNGTATDNPGNARTDVTIGASGAIGFGAPSSTQSGAIVLPATTSCIEVDLSSGPATCALNQNGAPAGGLAYAFDLVGNTASQTFTMTAPAIESASNGGGSGPPQSTHLVITGSGQQIVVKYVADKSTWLQVA